MNSVTAVILAGGIGKRFTPFVTDKTLFPFMGKTLLDRTLEMILEAGITQVVIAVNRYNEDWVSGARERYPQLDIQSTVQAQPNGMGDALLALKPFLPERDIVVMNAGDMVDRRLLPELLQFCQGKYAVLTGMRTPVYQPLGYFTLSDSGQVTGIMEKPGAENMPSDLANLVFHYFSRPNEFLELVFRFQEQVNGADDVYEQALDELMKTQAVDVYQYEGAWQKLKFGYHVLDMTEFFLLPVKRFISPDAMIAGTATINGEVVVEAGARILDGAVIQGPCWIGPNVIIGNNALVRQSIIEEGAVVGFSSEIVRSYVGPKCDLHHAYVGDSILEKTVHFGYNAHTANYRFDHEPVPMNWVTGKTETPHHKLGALIAEGTEVGVNASIMPGICIGRESIVYPAAVVFAPIPDRSIVREKRAQTIEPLT